MLPWKLFGLTPRDASGELLRVVNRQQGGTTGGASEGGLSYTVPAEKYLIITGWGATGAGFAAGTPIGAMLRISYAGLEVFRMAQRMVAVQNPSGTFVGYAGMQSWVVARPLSEIVVAVQFNTVADHSLTASLTGVLIPKGDMSEN